MSGFVKKLKFFINASWLAVLTPFAVLGLATCNIPMGMGPQVDTVAPIITITSPVNGQFLTGIIQGDPVPVTGTWSDNSGHVSHLRFHEVYRSIELNEMTAGLDYTINNDGTWEAFIILQESGTYRISATLYDSFGNAGKDEVIVSIDIIPPWVEDVWINRPAAGNTFRSELRDVDFYNGIQYNIGDKPHKNIRLVNIDDYQNETFTLVLKIDSAISEIAASRLNIYDEDDNLLNDEYLAPTGGTVYQPEWTVIDSKLSAGNSSAFVIPATLRTPNVLRFEVMAWTTPAWNFDTGSPRPEEPYLIDNVNGTCWYPDSDQPVVYVASNDQGIDQVTLNQGMDLIIDFYDDDALAEIYAALIFKADFDDLLMESGEANEAVYLESLLTNTGRRNALIANVLGDNKHIPFFSPDNRVQTIRITGTERGEFRLIALAKDNNTWGVYPPLRVNIVDPQSPLIIVEEPAAENMFPVLNQGNIGATNFRISGYTIDAFGTNYVFIAWVPYGARAVLGETENVITAARNAITAAAGISNWSFGESRVVENQIKVWKLPEGESTSEEFGSTLYYKNTFSQTFDVLSDFKFNNKLENRQKIFVIGTSNGGPIEFKTFILSSYDTNPEIQIEYPDYDKQIHSKSVPLILKMRASTAEGSGISIKPSSLTITDVTSGNLNPELGFDTNPAPVNNEKERRVSASFVDGLPEGDTRTYKFTAEDALGNFTEVTRMITISNIPALSYVTASNDQGTYGIGTVLNFEAVFTLPVNITRGVSNTAWPRLNLYSANPEEGNPPVAKYAEYVQGPASNTMIFRYTVKEGDNIPKLFTSRSPIDYNGATIKSTQETADNAIISFNGAASNANSLQGRNIGIDGIRPKVTHVGFTAQADGRRYHNEGKTFNLELTLDKQVRVSQTPVAKIYVGRAGNPADAHFTSVSNDGKTLSFSYMVPGDLTDINAKVSWVNPWISFPPGSSITDYAGNDINLVNLPAVLDGSPDREAHILTTSPLTPTISFSKAPGSDGIIKTNANITATIGGVPGTSTIHISLEDGNNAVSLGAGNTYTITDRTGSNPNSSAYQPAEYYVKAWQVDRAGNVSDSTATHRVDFNTRAPELESITCDQQDGSYSKDGFLNFKLRFSRTITRTTGTVTMRLRGTVTGHMGEIEITASAVAEGNAINFGYNVGPNLMLKGIEVYEIDFPASGFADEYGNVLKDYSGTAAEDTSRRPFVNNLNRNGIIIDTASPHFIFTGLTPTAPNANATEGNGGLIGSNQAGVGTITLKFDKPVTKLNGDIIIRPYGHEGKWAVPPVLEVEEFNRLRNSTNFYDNATDPYSRAPVSASLREIYRQRLSWLDDKNLPRYSTDFNLNTASAAVMRTERNKWNYYVNTTRGIINNDGQARPNTTGLWVLAFRHDLYEDIQDLRDVFNAAEWQWQRIPSSHPSVTTSTIDENGVERGVVTIKLQETLQSGRIWEVIVQAGAFEDAAKNKSVSLNSGQYRFWSRGTATPVVRVDRYSQGDNYHGIWDPVSNMFKGSGNDNRPKIDTRIRIDSETPGASISYDVIRTHFKPAAAGTGTNTSQVFTTATLNTGLSFFNHPNINTGTVHSSNVVPENNQNYTNRGGNPGFGNNWIGSGGSFMGGTARLPDRDSRGFFLGLLVPNNVSGTGNDTAYNANAGVQIAQTQNGAVLYTELTTKGNNLVSGGALTGGRVYRSTTPATEGLTYTAHTFGSDAGAEGTSSISTAVNTGSFFYIGDAFKTNTSDNGLLSDRNAIGDTDSSLFSGRRDYIAAAARKEAINTGPYSGPQLEVSGVDYEGVFKTTVLHRYPNGRRGSNNNAASVNYNGTGRGSHYLLLQGFDAAVTTTVTGFPISEVALGVPPRTGAGVEVSYHTRQAWRLGNTNPTTNLTNLGDVDSLTGANTVANNHYIWVSWDIVCDWYHKGMGHGSQNRTGANYNGIICTYGAVTYRFEQRYHWDDDGGTQ